MFPRPKYDGVLGMWYGKGPGVDRTGDIFKHANYAGIGRWGGVLALGGDDPLSKSSTLPTHSEVAFYDAFFPTLFPGNVQEILDLGRYGFEMSRYSGLWVGFKIVTDVADEIGTAVVSPDRLTLVSPEFVFEGRPWQAMQQPMLMPPFGLETDRQIHYGRLEAAKAFAAANRLNRITIPTAGAWLGIAAAGKTYCDLREALLELGLDDEALRRHGIRLLKIGMMFPMEPSIVREFARGLEELLVVEEKRSFIELVIRDTLYNLTERPRVVGKQDEQGKPLVPANGELDADRIAQIVATRLERRIPRESITARVALLGALRERPAPLTLARQPYFCSGCPHNRSTVLPEGSIASAGIGCHGMALLMDRRTMGLTHMGGEGVQWVGMAPFTETPHIFQNLGDGTFFHSGSLAVRQAVAAGTNITYKILYNSAVAMTGGQDAAGAMPVPELTRSLHAEGVRRIIVMTDEPDKYAKNAQWAPGVEVWHRERLDKAQQVLRAIPGVTALVYDQRCAAEKRRLRRHGRRDRQPDPRHGRAPGRQARPRPRPDGPLPEGWPRRLAPQDLRASAGGVEQGGGGVGRLLPRLRPPGRDVAPEPRPREPRPYGRDRLDEQGPDGRHGDLDRRRVSGPGRARRVHQPLHPQGRERLPRRAGARRDALRRPHGRQHDRARRRLPGGRHSGERRGHRGSDRAQWRVGPDEYPRLPRRPALRRRPRVGEEPEAAATRGGRGPAGARARGARPRGPRGGHGRAPAPPRDPCARALRLPERGVRG